MKKIFYFLSLITVLVVVACANPFTNSANMTNNTPEKPELEKVRLLLAAEGNAMYYAYIARENGYFAEEGLDVDLVPDNGGAYVVEQIASDLVDIGIVAVPSLLPAWNNDLDIQVVYQINSTNLFDLIVPKYSDISNIGQLKGKVIGVTDFGGAEVPMVHSLLASAGLNADSDVTLKAFGNDANAIMAAFDNGEIAAFSGGRHDLVFLNAENFKSKSLIPKVYKALPSTAIIVNGNMIKERPDLVEKITRSVARGIHFSINNRNTALEIMKKVDPKEYKNEMLATMSLNTFIDLSTPIETEKGYGHIYQDSWKKLIELYSVGENPIITKEIDLDKYLNTSFLEKANQFER